MNMNQNMTSANASIYFRIIHSLLMIKIVISHFVFILFIGTANKLLNVIITFLLFASFVENRENGLYLLPLL